MVSIFQWQDATAKAIAGDLLCKLVRPQSTADQLNTRIEPIFTDDARHCMRKIVEGDAWSGFN